MATILSFGPLALFRSEASSHVIYYQNGQMTQSGPGLAFWFLKERASIIELPMDDRQTTLFVKGHSQDFQEIAVQGTVIWHITKPEKLAGRVDFTLDLASGGYNADPIGKIEGRVAALAEQAAMAYLEEAPVRTLLDSGVEPLRARLEALLLEAPVLKDIGVQVVGLNLGRLAPSKELERALQTPTFESLQQKADEAMFQRRALAVDKERAIAENELANKTELARRENELIEKEAENARARASAAAEANGIEAAAEAGRIKQVEGARTDAERDRTAIYRDLPHDVLMGLAAREFAKKLKTIEHLNVSPDLLAMLTAELGKARTPSLPG
ncbi:MAG: SPFH domain-containing protein [Pseudomonadota bacterium]